jgi:hypothetical protein
MKKYLAAVLIGIIGLAVGCVQPSVSNVKYYDEPSSLHIVCYYKTIEECRVYVAKECKNGFKVLDQSSDEDTAKTIATIDATCLGKK